MSVTKTIQLFLILAILMIAPAMADTYSCSIFPVMEQDVLDEDNKMDEPSGIAFHPMRNTLFIVSDNDFIYETDHNAVIKRSAKVSLPDVKKLDLEGVTVNTRTGAVYVISEKLDSILELNPDTFTVVGVYTYPEKFGKRTVFNRKGDGPEAIAFMPGKKQEEDVIFVCNQHDPPNLIKMKAPIHSKNRNLVPIKLTVISVTPFKINDLSAASYCRERDTLFVVSDFNNIAFELTRDCKIIRIWALPGDEQEGIAFVNNYLYIAQDSGKILRCRLDKSFFRKSEVK